MLTLSVILGSAACGGGSHTKTKPRPYDTPTVSGLLSMLESRQNDAHSFLAESRMEYWLDGERIKPTVYVMGERGAKVRFNALNPAGNDVAADLACNGANFQFIDFNHDCQMVGLCNKDAISKLLRISLEPDDFLLLAIGSTPVIDDAEGEVHWDPKTKHEILSLHSADGSWKQDITFDGTGAHWDLLSSTVYNSEGKIEWKITNKEFSKHTSEDNKVFRLPAKTRFEQPIAKAEVSIRWVERSINVELSEDKFEMEIPALPTCQ